MQSVPLVLALGVSLGNVVGANGFGILALASVGPIVSGSSHHCLSMLIYVTSNAAVIVLLMGVATQLYSYWMARSATIQDSEHTTEEVHWSGKQ